MPNSQTVELFTLYALGVSFTILRTYARIVAVGVRDLRVDDYLIWLAIVRIPFQQSFAFGRIWADLCTQLIYSAQCALGYNVGVAAHGLDNSGMTPAQRSALSPDDPEYQLRYATSLQVPVMLSTGRNAGRLTTLTGSLVRRSKWQAGLQRHVCFGR
jgi:hypothetical protein